MLNSPPGQLSLGGERENFPEVNHFKLNCAAQSCSLSRRMRQKLPGDVTSSFVYVLRLHDYLHINT